MGKVVMSRALIGKTLMAKVLMGKVQASALVTGLELWPRGLSDLGWGALDGNGYVLSRFALKLIGSDSRI